MKSFRKIFCVIFVISLFSVSGFSQVLIQYNQDRTYTLVERTDLRRYDNGRYIGLLSREVRSFIHQDQHPKFQNFYQGDFFVLEKTKRNSYEVTLGINEAIPSSFTISDETGGVCETSIAADSSAAFFPHPVIAKQNINAKHNHRFGFFIPSLLPFSSFP